jgi:hypothetical protein
MLAREALAAIAWSPMPERLVADRDRRRPWDS